MTFEEDEIEMEIMIKVFWKMFCVRGRNENTICMLLIRAEENVKLLGQRGHPNMLTLNILFKHEKKEENKTKNCVQIYSGRNSPNFPTLTFSGLLRLGLSLFTCLLLKKLNYRFSHLILAV